MHAIMVKRLGHNVHLYEQNLSSIRTNRAAGIGTGPKGIEYFNVYDLCDQPYAFSCPGFQFLDKNANIKRFLSLPLNLTSWDVLYYRLRANFDALKSQHCLEPPSELKTDGKALYDLGKRAVSVSSNDNFVTVEYEDLVDGGGGSIHADLVIVADGFNSVIRQVLLPNLKRTYSGYVAWRGTVPERDLSEETTRLFDKHFNAFVMSRGYIVG